MKTFLTCCLAALLGFGLLAARPAQAKQHLLLGSSIVGGSYYVLGGTYVFPNSLVDQISQLIA